MRLRFLKNIILRVLATVLGFSSIFSCDFSQKEPWERPQRVKLTIPEKLRVEYQNNGDLVGGDSEVRTPSYCTIVKDGDIYYTKVPTMYRSNRLEVMRKGDLKNPVLFSDPEYSQGFITAVWNGGTNAWLMANNDECSPNDPYWHANDQNNHVYYVATAFLDHGYGNINHIYDNGIPNNNGHKHTSTQLDNTTLTIGDNKVECIVWQYEAWFGEDNWSLEKYWLDKETNIVLKKSYIYPNSEEKDIDNEANVNFKATYFSKDVDMDEYLASVERGPAPDFSTFK